MKTFTMTVVTINNRLRCVYVNNYRLVGSKPYVSEGGDYKKMEFTLDNLRSAFPQLEINERHE